MHKIKITLVMSASFLWISGAPIIISAATPKTFAELVSFLIGYINIIVPLIITAAVVFYMRNTLLGLISLKGGTVDPDWKKGMLWGIGIIFLMVSIWGVLSILAATFQIPIVR